MIEWPWWCHSTSSEWVDLVDSSSWGVNSESYEWVPFIYCPNSTIMGPLHTGATLSFTGSELTWTCYQCRVVQHIQRSLWRSKLRSLSGNVAIARPIAMHKVLTSMKLGVRELGSSEENFGSCARIQWPTNFTLKQLRFHQKYPLLLMPIMNLWKGLAQCPWRLNIRHQRWILKVCLLFLQAWDVSF